MEARVLVMGFEPTRAFAQCHDARPRTYRLLAAIRWEENVSWSVSNERWKNHLNARFIRRLKPRRYASVLGGSTIRTGRMLAIRVKSARLCVITAASYAHAVAASNTSLRNARSRAAPIGLRRASTPSA